jgi:hypothetical protein
MAASTCGGAAPNRHPRGIFRQHTGSGDGFLKVRVAGIAGEAEGEPHTE